MPIKPNTKKNNNENQKNQEIIEIENREEAK
jgi:hypothetical protein